MTDILDEIEQDLRRDRMRRVWKRYGWLIATVAALFVLAIAGWRGYAAWEASRSASTGDRYLQAIEAAERGEHEAAVRELEALIRSGAPGGYPALARFRIAASLAGRGDTAGAVAAFDALSNDTTISESFRDIARLRAGLLLVDGAPYAEVQRRLERIATAPANPFRHTAREILGLAAYRAEERQTAARWFRDLVVDGQAPESARNRGSLALTMLAADGVTPPQ